MYALRFSSASPRLLCVLPSYVWPAAAPHPLVPTPRWDFSHITPELSKAMTQACTAASQRRAPASHVPQIPAMLQKDHTSRSERKSNSVQSSSSQQAAGRSNPYRPAQPMLDVAPTLRPAAQKSRSLQLQQDLSFASTLYTLGPRLPSPRCITTSGRCHRTYLPTSFVLSLPRYMKPRM